MDLKHTKKAPSCLILEAISGHSSADNATGQTSSATSSARQLSQQHKPETCSNAALTENSCSPRSLLLLPEEQQLLRCHRISSKPHALPAGWARATGPPEVPPTSRAHGSTPRVGTGLAAPLGTPQLSKEPPRVSQTTSALSVKPSGTAPLKTRCAMTQLNSAQRQRAPSAAPSSLRREPRAARLPDCRQMRQKGTTSTSPSPTSTHRQRRESRCFPAPPLPPPSTRVKHFSLTLPKIESL